MSADTLTHLIVTYGYWAILFVVALESTGLPLPGETILILGALYAGSTHRLEIGLVILAAAAGAIIGDNFGFLIGQEGGYRLARRFGRFVGLDERRLRLGEYLFARHGGKVVFFGRFMAILRTWSAFFAGTNRMPWRRFLAFNAAGGATWAALFGAGGYVLGDAMERLDRLVGLSSAGLVVVGLLVFWLSARRYERRLDARFERSQQLVDSSQ